MRVAVDVAELVIGFHHASGAPVQRHRAVAPALDVLGECSRQISIMDSMELVERGSIPVTRSVLELTDIVDIWGLWRLPQF